MQRRRQVLDGKEGGPADEELLPRLEEDDVPENALTDGQCWSEDLGCCGTQTWYLYVHGCSAAMVYNRRYHYFHRSSATLVQIITGTIMSTGIQQL